MKPISPIAGLNSTRIASLVCAAALLCPLAIPARAQVISTKPVVSVNITPSSDRPNAIVISLEGKCEVSTDGKTFTELKKQDMLFQGAVIRAGKDAHADLFFRRIGTTVRLQPETEVLLESMTREIKDGEPEMKTLLDLRKGRIFTVVRSLVPGCTFEIRNAAGRSVVEGGGGKGRYIITADGTHVADSNSAAPLKVIGETGITVVAPGQQFNKKEGKAFHVDAPAAVQGLIDFDELDQMGEKAAAELK